MAENKKRAVDIRIDEKESTVPASQTKAEFKALIEAYAKRSPEKFALKKATLEAQLAAMS